MKYSFLLAIGLSFSCTAASQLNFKHIEQEKGGLLDAMTDSVKNGKYEEITSILIAKDGELIYEKYFQGNDSTSKHNVRSGTKTIATLLTGIAIHQGYIASEQDPILKYLGHKAPFQNPDPRKEKMTIEDLLTMSSLMECDDNNNASRGWEERMYIIEDWSQFFLDLPIRSFPYGPAPEDAKYGRSMSYCSAGAATLAEVVESAVDVPASQFLEENLLRPLKITDYTLHHTPVGILNTAGGSEYRSRDLLKIIQLLMNKGAWNGEQILTPQWVEKATSPKAEAWEGMEYGYLLWLRSYGPEGKEHPGFAMAGNGGQKMIAFPDLGLTVVLTTTNYNNRNAHGYTDELLNDFIVPSALN